MNSKRLTRSLTALGVAVVATASLGQGQAFAASDPNIYLATVMTTYPGSGGASNNVFGVDFVYSTNRHDAQGYIDNGAYVTVHCWSYEDRNKTAFFDHFTKWGAISNKEYIGGEPTAYADDNGINVHFDFKDRLSSFDTRYNSKLPDRVECQAKLTFGNGTSVSSYKTFMKGFYGWYESS
jgi:hypothetical protein